MKLFKNINLKQVNIIVYLILLISSIVACTFLMLLNALTIKRLLFVYGVYVVMLVVVCIGLLSSRIHKILRNSVIVLSALLIIFNSVASYVMFSSLQTLSRISDSSKEEITYQVYVLKTSPAQNLKDLDRKRWFFDLSTPQYESIAKTEIEKANLLVEHVRIDGNNGFDALKNDQVDAVITTVNEVVNVRSNDTSFDDTYRLVHEFKVVNVIENNNKVTNITNTPFIVYVSGIDTYGSVQGVSRSDVNILMVVNPQKHEILMVNMPRDLFVYIPCKDDYDKLTHTGISGISCSLQTMENFFDNKINYYVRLNFTSLVNVIDAIGGVDVDNPYSFYTGTWTEPENNLQFDEGRLHLDGHKALVYARERMSLREGDIDRGRNQRRIIEGMINKIKEPTTLLNFDAILKTFEQFIQTNMPQSQIQELIKHQLDDGRGWKIYTQEIKTESGMSGGNASPSIPLYMAFPIIESRLHVINQIENLLSGKTIDETIVSEGRVDYKGSR